MKDEFKKYLKNKGLKITNQRLIILEIFYNNKMPLNAEEVGKKINTARRSVRVNGVTIYRTLTSLAKAKILKRVDLRKDSIYFELNNQNHHHHIVCTECNNIEDFNNKEVEKILEKITKNSYKFKNITEHSLELFGLCNECIK